MGQTRKIPAEAVELYTRFIHGEISRRDFFNEAQRFAVAGLTGTAITEALMPVKTIAQIIKDRMKSLPDLQDALQTAMRLEFSTIPPYLCAQWSINADPGGVGNMIQSIVVEEVARAQQRLQPVIGSLSAQSADDDYVQFAVPFLQGPQETDMSRARTRRSNTAGRRTNSIACRCL
jgi:Ferritin-like